MARLRALIAVALVGTTAVWTAAQVRDGRGVSPAATAASVSGRVEIETSGQHAPVRRANVTLKGEATGQTWTTASDADGRFQFDVVSAGRYQLFAEKGGFVPLTPVAAVEIQPAGTTSVNLGLRRAAALEGRFIDSRGDPIAHLSVAADRLLDAQNSGATTAVYSAVTDDLGRFRVHTLPPGRYRLHATPPPPASDETLFYPGTTNQNEAGIITVASGETRDGLEFAVAAAPLSPIAAEALAAAEREANSAPEEPGLSARIGGHIVRSDTGQGIVNASVQLLSGPGVTPNIRTVARTNTEGRFEFTRLAAGPYDLTVTAVGYNNTDAAPMRPGGAGIRVIVKDSERNDRVEVKLAPASAIEVRALDEFGDPAPGVVLQISQQMVAAGVPRFLPGITGAVGTTGPTDDRGWFRAAGLFSGDYYLLALPEPFERSGPAAFAPTFFPGTTSFGDATAVHIVPGMDALDLRFSLASARAATIAGVAVGTEGQPLPGAEVMLLPTDNGEVKVMVMARSAVNADGSFSFVGVPEGQYVLQGFGPALSGPALFGSTRVTVPAIPDRERNAVRLTLRPLTTARGHVVFEGDAPPSVESGSVSLAFQPTDYTMGPVGSNRIASSIAGDWTFEIPDLAWFGVIRANATGWTLAQVRLQGRDITDVPTDFQTADVQGLEVVMTRRTGSISGSVAGVGPGAPDATVLVFSADSADWLYLSRTTRAGQVTDHGTFNLSGLLPGRYLAVAVPTQRQAQPLDLPWQLALRARATPVSVAEGANATLSLTLVK